MADLTSPSLPPALLACPSLSATAKLAWLGLASTLPQVGTVRSVAAATGMTFGQAQRALVELKAAGWIENRMPAMVRLDPPMDQIDPLVDQGDPPMDQIDPLVDQGDPPMDQSDPPMDQKNVIQALSTVVQMPVIRECKGEKLSQDQTGQPPPNPPRKPAKAQVVKPHNITTDWQPSDETRLFAAQHCPSVDLERELRKFRDYWREKNGRRPGWDRSFRSWLERAEAWALERPRAASPASPHSSSPHSSSPHSSSLGGARATSPGPSTTSGQRLMELLKKERRHA